MDEILNGLGPSVLSLTLSVLFSIAYASFYHLWVGRSGRELFLLIVMSFIGFIIGHAIGVFLQFEAFRIGQLYALEASIGSWVIMIGAHITSTQR